MLTRTAIYEGTVEPGREDEFFRAVTDRLDPIWRRFPHVQAVRVGRVISADSDAPPVAMVMEMDYADEAAMADSLASPIRETAHAATLDVMKLFDGRFYHLVSHAQVFTAASAETPAQLPTAG